jgi:hypothetical protein
MNLGLQLCSRFTHNSLKNIEERGECRLVRKRLASLLGYYLVHLFQ